MELEYAKLVCRTGPHVLQSLSWESHGTFRGFDSSKGVTFSTFKEQIDRQDCSGYVSYCWASSTSGGGHVTSNMQEICTKIGKNDLKFRVFLFKTMQ